MKLALLNCAVVQWFQLHYRHVCDEVKLNFPSRSQNIQDKDAQVSEKHPWSVLVTNSRAQFASV